MSETKRVGVGDVAPDFVLPDQSGTPVRLGELLGGRSVVLYFYPKDSTPGCMLETRAFQKSYERFDAANAEIVGISSDSVASHRRFARRHGVAFRLLSDRDGAVRRLYGVDRTLGIFPGRVTYVIDRTGVVRHIYSSQVLPTRHSHEALDALRAIGDAPA